MHEIVSASLSGLVQIFSWPTFGLMLIGIGVGFMVGILPGLGGATALALMLPFVIKMKAVEAFAFLLGMTAVINTTGDITSVLLGVPGEAAATATIVDGHPMAKKGEAGRALGAALMSSLVGAIFGAFALAVAIPIVRPLVLSFRSPEFFMLAILGLTFVASLSGEALLKGLIAGGIGLFLATIGLDPQSGIQRYTFGQLFLWDGIGLVPVAIGLFAIPEIIDLGVRGASIAEGVSKLGGVMVGVKDTFRHFWMVIRCSAIGTFTGLIPGMGSATTQWLAYAHAVQSSPDKDRFGKGAVEGVLGPGAANNSTLGGSLTTTVAFGIPSSVLMAILLGAFLIQGIVPGPSMLIAEPKGHLSLTFSFVWTIIISNIITVGVCFLFLNQLVKVTHVRASLIVPFLILLVYLGAFAEKNKFEDLAVMLFVGGLGWVFPRFGWPRSPVILGLVLGSMAENRLFLSVRRYGFDWLFRPVVLLIMAVILASILYPIFKARWKKKEAGSKRDPLFQSAANRIRKALITFSWATVFDFALVAIFTWALWESRHFGYRAGLFPWAVGFPILALVIIQFVIDLIGKGVSSGDDPMTEAGPKIPTYIVNRRTAGIFAWFMGYFVAIWLLGFSIGGPLCIFLQLKIGAREKWLLSLILSGFAWAIFYGIFERIMNVPFPTGYLFL